jgi:hypothetical protein
VILLPLLALLAAPPRHEGRPLFYWGARPALLELSPGAEGSPVASIIEVRGAVDKGELVVRFDLDREVRQALYLPDGTPVSGRLRAVLYLDADDDPKTGFETGKGDFRTGADLRLDLGSVSIGEDPEEKRPADVIVSATLYSLTREGRRRTLWRGDDEAEPLRVSAHGEWVEVRLPREVFQPGRAVRMILATDTEVRAGRLVTP